MSGFLCHRIGQKSCKLFLANGLRKSVVSRDSTNKVWHREGTLDEDFNGDKTKLSWQPRTFASHWTPRRVVGAIRSYVDLSKISLVHPVYSERAISVLRDLLEPNGELLPIITDAGTYFVFNVLKISNALDRNLSQIPFPPPSSNKETANGIDFHVFNSDELTGHAIFRVREWPSPVYVTDEYKKRVEAASLNGFCFNKVWPLMPGESWRTLAARQRRVREQEVAKLNGQSFSIQLETASAIPSQAEIDQGYKLAEQLASILASVQASRHDAYVGGVETTETGKKALEIHLSGPDSAKIQDTIQSWLTTIDWPNHVQAICWQGQRHDKKIAKTKVKVK